MPASHLKRIMAVAVVVALAGLLGGTYLAGQTLWTGAPPLEVPPSLLITPPPLQGTPYLVGPGGQIYTPSGWFMPPYTLGANATTFRAATAALSLTPSNHTAGEASTELIAAPASPQKLALATERVVVFKDGYGLIIKSASATADADGKVFTTDVPDAAVLGTFWATADDANAADKANSKKLLAMRAEWDDSHALQHKAVPCLTVRELLRANLGKRVTLTLTAGEKGETHSVTGTVTKLLEEKTDPDAPVHTAVALRDGAYTYTSPKTTSPFEDPSSGAAFPDGGTLTRTLSPLGGDYLVIENTETGRLVLPVAQVQSVGGPDVLTETTRDEEVFSRTKRLSFDFGKESANKPVSLHLFYFTPGFRWIPTYRLSGDLKDHADLALQGEILNDVEDIKGAALDLVVGVPNFRFKDAISPLSLERQMRTVFANMDRNNSFSNSAFLQSQFSNGDNRAFAPGSPPAVPSAPAELAGAAEQDLYVHPFTNFTLRKGARAAVPLLQTTAPIRHLYTYEVKARRSRSTGGLIKGMQDDPSSPLKISVNNIWHQLEVKNDTKDPWTTGAALLMRGNLPIGQDLLTYTPPGSSTLLPVTIAIDLRGTTDEEEIERHPNALRFDTWDYAQIKKKGTITVTSFRTEKSAMRVTLSTGGKVEAASDDGKIKINDFRPDDWDDPSYMRPNNHSDVTWEFDLEAGKTKTLTYTVSSYIH